MNETLTYTIREMYRLADQHIADLTDVPLPSMESIFSFVRSLPYVPDTARGFPELLQRPAATIARGGDCDDKAILAGAALSRIGVPWRLVTVSVRPDGAMQHVYPEIFYRNAWRAFDATYPNAQLFSAPRSTARITWDRTDVNYNTRLGVTTLEGLGLPPDTVVVKDGVTVGTPPIVGTSPVNGVPNFNSWESLTQQLGKSVVGNSFDVKSLAVDQVAGSAALLGQALIPIPAIGAVIGAAVGALAALIGVRGPTQHLDLTKVDQLAGELKTNILKFYDTLPADGQAAALALGDNFLAAMQRDFGVWWGGMDLAAGDTASEGLLNRRVRQAKAGGNFADPRARFGNSFSIPFGVMLRGADADTVQKNISQWYFVEHFQPVFAKPMQDYVTAKIGGVLQYDSKGNVVITGANPVTAIAGFPVIGWVLLAGVGWALLSTKNKKALRGAR